MHCQGWKGSSCTVLIMQSVNCHFFVGFCESNSMHIHKSFVRTYSVNLDFNHA